MWSKSKKTESSSETLRVGSVSVREAARHAPLGLTGLAALFCGAGAVLLLAEATFNLLVFDCRIALLFTAGTSVLIWVTRLFTRYRGLWACVAAGVAALAVWRWEPDALLPRCRLLWRLTLENPYALSELDMTQVICLAAVVFVLLLYLVAFVFRLSWIAYGVSLPFTILAAALGRLPFWPVPMLLLFHTQAHLESARRQPPAQHRDMRSRRRASGHGSMLLAAVCLAAFFGVYAVLQPHMDAILALPRRVQAVLLPDNTDADDPDRTSAVSSGRYITGDDVLAVTVDVRPEGPIYLRNFLGGVYESGRWSAVDATAVFEALEADGLDHAREWMENGAYMRCALAGEQAQTLVVTRLNGSAAGDYTPYGAQLQSTSDNRDSFAYYPQAAETSASGAAIFPIDSLLLHSEPNGGEMQTSGGTARYAQFVEEAYAAVPDALEQLRAFCRENPQTGFENVRAFILETLHATTEYTLSPGLVPPGTDPAEYFLFYNKRGYCEHYATTAALLFRLYGYPARYVTGYVADGFHRQADGSYAAVLTDREAHAWIEVFVNGAWVPVEATPPGSVVDARPEGAATASPEAEETMQPTETPSPTATATASPTPQTQENAVTATETPVPRPTGVRPDETESALREWPAWLFPLLVGLGCMALTAICVALVRRRRFRRRCADAREMLAQCLKVLQRAGMLRGMDGTERDFPVRLQAAVPEIGRAQAEKLQADALASAFGSADPRPAEPEIYRKCRKAAAAKRMRRRK